MTLLEVRGVKKSFGLEKVLRNVTFNVNTGEIFGLVSVSGGGKTTIFNILMGLLSKDDGDVTFNGEKLEKGKKKVRLTTGFATQSNMIFEELTIKENCLYFGYLYNMKKTQITERMKDLLILLGLQGFESKLVRNLSGGMQKRANIMVSLINSPKMLLLDEPTTGLDPLLRRTFWKYIREINNTGTTVIVASHLLDELGENCHRIAVLKNGQITAVGTPKQYLEMFGNKNDFREVFEYLLSK